MDTFATTEQIGEHGTAELLFVETWDGLYAPVGLRIPDGPGPFPLILLASGNGGEGVGWIRDALANRGWTMDRLI
ncbi:MAG: hypothetical protein OEM40_07500, partial [Acidimicrobiia bacterium]|nr:hypothetical protein [Acidimicrobiia bacterium]